VLIASIDQRSLFLPVRTKDVEVILIHLKKIKNQIKKVTLHFAFVDEPQGYLVDRYCNPTEQQPHSSSRRVALLCRI